MSLPPTTDRAAPQAAAGLPVAVVTGGARNIGAAVARRLASTHRIVVGDLVEPEPDPAVAFVKTDVGDADDCERLIRHARRLGPVRTVVHCAAITAPQCPIEAIDPRQWRRLIDVNLNGSFLVARAAIGALREAGGGSVVLLTSRAGKTGFAALDPSPDGTKAHYCASKAGVIALTKSLAIELAPLAVRVNAVAPGSIEGTMIPRERWRAIAQRVPLGRLGRPEEIADAVAFLCSEQASYITGHVLDVNGGTLMD